MKSVFATKRLLLLGAGGHGRVVADIAEMSGWKNVEFLDDRWPEISVNLTWPVIGKLADLGRFLDYETVALASVGDNRLRLRCHRRLTQMDIMVPSVVHPSAIVSSHARIGSGTVVMANAVVNVGAVVGESVIINTGATVDHDCHIADGAHISPGAHIAGGVSIGEESWVGIGSAVKEGLKIGCRVICGAGAAVVADVEDDVQVVGVPARKTVGNRKNA
jgi:sugar O-acyltransferase (sialic acid O-acetyltransferase NeuD family)